MATSAFQRACSSQKALARELMAAFSKAPPRRARTSCSQASGPPGGYAPRVHSAGRFRALGAPALALALLVYLVAASPFPTELRRAFGPPAYAEKRAHSAFGGIDMDGVRARLDGLLGPEEPVALAPSLADEDFFHQRFTEGLYPRPVVARAHWTIVPYERGKTKPWRVLGALGHLDLVLTGERDGPEPTVAAPAPAESAWSALGRGALALLALVGFGALVGGRMTRDLEPAARLGANALTGAAVVALAWNATTWSQTSVSCTALTIAGLVAFALVCARAVKRRAWSARGGSEGPTERVVLGAVALLLSAWLLATPLALWDGRSIWLYHARRLWEHGAFLARDATDAASAFSHPDYPLFFPAQLAFFAGPGATFHERSASLAIAVLSLASIALAHGLGRDRLGRWSALLLPLALIVATGRSLAGGYADGFLTLLLWIEFLALSSGHVALAALAAACAATTKLEGGPLAALVVAILLATRGADPGRGARRAWPLLFAFLPALAHLLWTRSLGLDSLLKGGSTSSAAAAFGGRALAALRELPGLVQRPGYTGVRSILLPGLVAWLVVPFLLLRARDRAARCAGAAWGVALGAATFGVCAIALLPEDVAWFVDTALDRLLVHAAAFALLALFLALAPRAFMTAAAEPAGSAASAPPFPSAGAGDRSTPATEGAGAG